MDQNSAQRANFLLDKMLAGAGSQYTLLHPFFSEDDRWKELVFALLTQVTLLDQLSVRLVSDQLLQLGLLQVDNLAGLMQEEDGKIDFTKLIAEHLLEILEEGGFTREDAIAGITVMAEAATATRKLFAGRIQYFLRHYGEKMLEDAKKIFQFSLISDKCRDYAIAYWLQNTLNMPLPLPDGNAASFCASRGCSLQQLYDAADARNVNIALVDDLLNHYHAANMTEFESPSTEKD